MTPEELFEKRNPQDGKLPEWAKMLMLEFAVEQLQQHVEHPTKPGYRRHDILKKIKELKHQYDEN